MERTIPFLKNTLRKYWLLLLFGVVIGLSLPGISLGLGLVVLVVLVVRRKSESWQDRMPYRLFLAGIGLRISIIGLKYIANTLTGKGLSVFGDSAMHLKAAGDASNILAGSTIRMKVPLIFGDYGYSITHWLYGAIYQLFGWSQFLLLIINVLAACLAALLIYHITMLICFHKPSAALAMGLCLFFPSQIMWSVELLKEPVIQLYTALFIYIFIIAVQKKRWWLLLPLAAMCYPFGHLRKMTHYIMFATFALGCVFVIPKRVKTSIVILILLAVAGTAMLRPSGIFRLWEAAQGRIIISQVGFITTGGSWYKFLPDRITPKKRGPIMTMREFPVAYVKAVGYLLMTPFPFKKVTFNKLPALPQMLVWYFLLIICFVPGVLYLLRYHFRNSAMVIIYLVVFTSAQALLTGNEGTAFRQRDVLTIFYFIPMAVGFNNIRGWLSQFFRSPNQRIPDATITGAGSQSA